MDYFNSKTGLIKTKYKTGQYIDQLFYIYLYMYVANILKLLLATFDQKYFYGNVQKSKLHPTIEKLYNMYTFWINSRHVAQLDYYTTQHIPFTARQIELFDHLGEFVKLFNNVNVKYPKVYYNLNVSEILMHTSYTDIELESLPKMTNDGKLQFIYNMRKKIPPELWYPLDSQCDECKSKPIPSITLERKLY